MLLILRKDAISLKVSYRTHFLGLSFSSGTAVEQPHLYISPKHSADLQKTAYFTLCLKPPSK